MTDVKYAPEGVDVTDSGNLIASAAGKSWAMSRLDTNAFNNYVIIAGNTVRSGTSNLITAIVYELDLTGLDSRDTAQYDFKVKATYGGDGTVKYYLKENKSETDSTVAAAIATSAQTLAHKDGSAYDTIGTSAAATEWHISFVMFVDGTTETTYKSSSMAVEFKVEKHS